MNNVIFEDIDLKLPTRLCSFIQEDKRGYYVDLYLRKSDVLKVMCADMIPDHTEDDRFTLRVRINNNTVFKLNNVRVYNFADDRLKAIPVYKLKLKQLVAKRYSKSTKNPAGYCYATKAFFNVEISKIRDKIT